MPISPNTTISQYTIVSKIGEGGMGEVYRARDTKLGRDVAIKVLPATLSADKERLARFEQEAQAAGALNHPNILSIYHIGTHDGGPYIVSELLQGETLRDRMGPGALPQRKAIDYALQIAKGLAAAHDKGIVHRDIKPENIFITDDGRVKILDFGLAKLTAPIDGTQPQTEVPTRKVNTDPGRVMGTMGYMSPEQLKDSQQIDHRSDIFSFGAILYEMLSGKRAFRADSIAETVSAILREDPPDLSETNKTVSPALERVVRHCLEKNPAERFHSARDLAFAIESLSGSAIISGQPANMPAFVTAESETTGGLARWFTNVRFAWIVAAVFALGLVGLAVLYFSRSPASTDTVVRLSFTAPPNLGFNDTQADYVVVSPNGQKIAFTATTPEGKTQLWVRSLESLEAQPLPGSEDALEPFWSPDSRSIAFGSQGILKRIDLAGGAAQPLCNAARMTGGAWNNEGVIIFGSDYGSALFQIPATGGEPKPVTFKDAGDIYVQHSNPVFLPDGRHFLFRHGGNTTSPRGVWVGSLDSKEIRQVMTDNTNVGYVPPGWLVFMRNQALVAQAFNPGTLELKGDAMPLATQTATRDGAYLFSVSDNGVLVWQEQWQRDYQLLWFDREGKQTGTVAPPMKVTGGQEPNLSPDGKRVVIKREGNIWVIDLARDTPVRLTSIFAQIPVWSPDGSRVAYSTRTDAGGAGIVQKAASGVGDEEMLLRGVNFANDWSPDGRFILFIRRGEKTRGDVWALPLFGDRKEYQLLNSAFDERNVQFSPDGHWLAYTSDESGNYEVYVRSFTADGKVGDYKKRISTNGGMQPKWRGDGQELFYIADDGQLMSVSVKTSAAEFEYSGAKALFRTRMQARSRLFHEYDVTADGQRFLIGTLIGESKAAPPVVILNWTAASKK